MRSTPARQRTRVAAGVCLAIALATGCGDGPPAAGGDATAQETAESTPTPEESGSSSPKVSASPSPPASSSLAPADPEHAVEPPGPRTGSLVPADLLVKSQVPLPDDLVKEIDRLSEVERSERFTLADISVENRVLSLAAVDPGSYRNYTPYASAELQEQWVRVAGGEAAIDKKAAERVVGKDGFLTLGNGEEAADLHVGAFAPQVNQVDAVVNEKWGEELGMPMGNALLVTTGMNAPRPVMKRIQKLLGDDAAVSILGPDVNPGAMQSAVLTGGTVAEAVGTFRYTVLGGVRIQPEQSWVEANIRTEAVPILGQITCHKVVLPQFRAALIEIQQRGLADKIHPDEYAGCYYPRFIAGTQQLSLHSFGIAFDINVPGNQRGSVGEIDRQVVEIFKKWGFAWGGDWDWTDPMHFEMERIVRPG